MIRIVAIVVLFLLVGVLSLGAYLSPDDLARCGETPSSQSGCSAADAIVAVSGGNTPVRTREAIKMYKNGWANLLIFSGAAKDTSGPSNAEVMKIQAVQAGVPADNIVTDDFSQTTHQNATHTNELIDKYHIHRLIVVTSPYHQRRAGLEFNNIMGDRVQIVDHPAPGDPDWPALWWMTPRGWWLAGGELVKITATHAGESQ